jgi:hypothetical protein
MFTTMHTSDDFAKALAASHQWRDEIKQDRLMQEVTDLQR